MATLVQNLLRSLAIGGAVLASLAAPLAQANVVTTTNGLTTTYTENFNGGSSFSGAWFDTVLNNDDYLWLTALDPVSSFTFSSAQPLSQLSLSFWYSVPGNNSGQVVYANSGVVSLADSPGSALQFLVNNPGAGNGGIGGGFDQQFTGTLFNLGAGLYTISFSTAGNLFDGLKVDDVQITTTAVPEPASLALFGLGLLATAVTNKRRSRQPPGARAAAGLAA